MADAALAPDMQRAGGGVVLVLAWWGSLRKGDTANLRFTSRGLSALCRHYAFLTPRVRLSRRRSLRGSRGAPCDALCDAPCDAPCGAPAVLLRMLPQCSMWGSRGAPCGAPAVLHPPAFSSCPSGRRRPRPASRVLASSRATSKPSVSSSKLVSHLTTPHHLAHRRPAFNPDGCRGL